MAQTLLAGNVNAARAAMSRGRRHMRVEKTRTERALRSIVEGTVAVTGVDFFRSLVRHLASALGVRCSLVTERLPGLPARVRVLAFWDGKAFHPSFDYEVEGHPCAGVHQTGMCHYPRRVRDAFPSDPYLAATEAESYLGFAMKDLDGRILGHVAVLDDRPMQADPHRLSILRIFAERAGAELQRLRVEAELQRRYDELHRLEASRESLAQMVVHDLRSPLVSVIGYLELIENGHVSGEAARESVRVVKRNAERLIDMVTDILDVARLESGRMALDLAPVDLRPLLEDVAADVRPLLRPKQVRLELDLCEDLPCTHADREILRRILVNIVSNAAAFAPRGSSIRVAAGTEAGQLWVRVTDSGPGIAPEDRERIFDRFGVLSGRRHGRKHSSGLGLAFCKLAVEAHGGRISVDSAPDGGSAFRFTLRSGVGSVTAKGCGGGTAGQ